MTDFTEETAVDAVIDSFRNTPDRRLREVLVSLSRHLHGFLRDARPTLAEWQQAIDFLTATGKACTDTRQEFILLSDVLGVSTMVEAINDDRPTGATAATVLGPFHMVSSPQRELGDTIDLVGTGMPAVVTGTVSSDDGTPIPHATLDVWQADDHGYYDVQQPERQRQGNGRGLFTTDSDGRFWFRTVVPSYYPIPTDGPVGSLLAKTGRHPYRPAHIHFIASADQHQPVTTHLFVADSDYLSSDAVFAVKQHLVREFRELNDPEQAARYQVANPFRHARFDIVLARRNG